MLPGVDKHLDLSHAAGMRLSFWKTRWQEGRIGFHEAAGNAKLRDHFADFVQSRHGPSGAARRVLVPLCGKSLDLSWLGSQGYEVIGVEFVEEAAVQFFAEAGITPERTQVGASTCYRHRGVSIVVVDFFSLSASEFGQVDMVYDRAALVAIEPGRRQSYVEQLARLLRPSGGVFLITFEHDIGGGPPFSIDDAEGLFRGYFELERQRVEDVLASESRFRERGASYLREVVWFGSRPALGPLP